jgi:DNA (cytosine-5)-methyltransferase 1
MRMLDCFSGAGGAARGYQMAGFHVTGVDIKPQPRYAGDVFIQGDALEFIREHGHEFDAIHASPPCQGYSAATRHLHDGSAPNLIDETRDAMNATGLPWVIENVPGAPLRNPITLCGLSFGINVKRHRLFESNVMLMSLPCGDHSADYFVIFGHEVRNQRHGHAAGRKNNLAAGRTAMGIEWMTRGELSQAIPPAYTEFIGNQLMTVLSRRDVA